MSQHAAPAYGPGPVANGVLVDTLSVPNVPPGGQLDAALGVPQDFSAPATEAFDGLLEDVGFYPAAMDAASVAYLAASTPSETRVCFRPSPRLVGQAPCLAGLLSP